MVRCKSLTTAAIVVAASAILANASLADPILTTNTNEPAAPHVPAPDLDIVFGDDFSRIAHLKEIQDPDALKQAFLDLFLPEIRQVNEAIEADREQLDLILDTIAEGRPMARADGAFLADLMVLYKTDDLVKLQRRVQPIPEAIALAQAALESGWGTSDLAREQLAFFGQIRNGGGFARFSSIEDSIMAYAINLNTHRAYLEFREARDGEMAPWDMVKTLTKYSELGRGYVKKVHAVMRSMEEHVPGILIAGR